MSTYGLGVTHGREPSILFDFCFMRCDPSTLTDTCSVCHLCRALCSVLGVGVTVPYRTVKNRVSFPLINSLWFGGNMGLLTR